VREALLDVAEGAGRVMVKPRARTSTCCAPSPTPVDVPVAAYQVSGEYAMVEAAAANGWIDRERIILEQLTGHPPRRRRMVLTYWATEAAGWLR
jgi:porphobilinogen synthase